MKLLLLKFFILMFIFFWFGRHNIFDFGPKLKLHAGDK